MQTCTMQLPNLEKQREAKQKSAIKRDNKPQAPLASKQRCPAQAVWWEYLWFASLMVISQEMEPDIYVFGSGV